jgi:hypothetical protein
VGGAVAWLPEHIRCSVARRRRSAETSIARLLHVRVVASQLILSTLRDTRRSSSFSVAITPKLPPHCLVVVTGWIHWLKQIIVWHVHVLIHELVIARPVFLLDSACVLGGANKITSGDLMTPAAAILRKAALACFASQHLRDKSRVAFV